MSVLNAGIAIFIIFVFSFVFDKFNVALVGEIIAGMIIGKNHYC
jgi:Kef-type K+ transport system membrane component KefB